MQEKEAAGKKSSVRSSKYFEGQKVTLRKKLPRF